jgi:hypothetical protein
MKDMNLVTILVTRSKACHVKTLHTVLRININCLQGGINNQILYVNDDPYEKADIIEKCMKKFDRILFIDFGIGMDDGSITQCFSKHENVGCLVFPGVKEGVDWNLFKQKVRSESSEPVEQMGLHFDTDVGKAISKDIYKVNSTNAKAWIMNTKNVIKSIKDKKSGNWKISPKMFERFQEQGVRLYAFTAAKLTMTYTHECISNILNAAGVKVN